MTGETAMTKQQEIAVLDSMIAKLGPNSYLGPWLADNREAIVSDINNDLPVEPMLPGAARRHASDILIGARMEATQIKADA